MLDAEFVKNIRKPPAVEFEIAASVFTSNEKNQQAYLSGWEL